MTPAEALVRALEAAQRKVHRRSCNEAAGMCEVECFESGVALAALRSWLANEAVETVAEEMWNHDDGRKDPWPWERAGDMEQTPYRGRARAALKAIFGELAP